MRAREGVMVSGLFEDDLELLYPHRRGRRLRLGRLRQRARAAHHQRRALAARGRHGHGARGLAGQHADGLQEGRLLRVGRLPDGAVGRPGPLHLRRRPLLRRQPRPQRPAPLPLLRHGRRQDHLRLRGRHHPRRARARHPEGPPAARPACCSSTPRPAASSTTRS